MRVALSTQIEPQWPLEQHARVAAAVGYEALEIVLGPPHAEAAYVEAEAARIPATLRDCGLAAACVTSTSDLDGTRVAEDAVSRAMRIASLLGASIVKIPSGKPSSHEATDADFAQCADGLKSCCQEASALGVVLTVETHLNMLTDTLAGTLRLLDMATSGEAPVSPASLGVTYDITNIHVAGDDPVAGVDLLKEWIRLVHVKDGRRGAEGNEWHPLGYGEVDLLGPLRQLKAVGYDGYVSVECLVSSGSYVRPPELTTPEEIAEHDCARVRELIAGI
jgi:sugar phosphate isomerase/epimerase